MALDVEDVIAHAVYDPVARRERYMRTRKLKGRQPVGRTPPKAGVGSRIVDANAPLSTIHVSATAARQAESDARQVAAIQGRLSKLKAHLAELLAQKKASSTSKPKSSSSTSKTDTKKTTNSKPKTAAQKQAAKESLKKAQEARAKEQKATPDKTPLTLDEQITRTRAVIADVETKLRAALDRAHPQTASNGR